MQRQVGVILNGPIWHPWGFQCVKCRQLASVFKGQISDFRSEESLWVAIRWRDGKGQISPQICLKDLLNLRGQPWRQGDPRKGTQRYAKSCRARSFIRPVSSLSFQIQSVTVFNNISLWWYFVKIGNGCFCETQKNVQNRVVNDAQFRLTKFVASKDYALRIQAWLRKHTKTFAFKLWKPFWDGRFEFQPFQNGFKWLDFLFSRR